jgi:hypothetical protein
VLVVEDEPALAETRVVERLRRRGNLTTILVLAAKDGDHTRPTVSTSLRTTT